MVVLARKLLVFAVLLAACADGGPADGRITLAVTSSLAVPNLLARSLLVELDEPGAVVVDCQPDGDDETRLWWRSDAVSTTHRTTLAGLYAGEWTCTAESGGWVTRTAFTMPGVDVPSPRLEGDPARGEWVVMSRRFDDDAGLSVYDPHGRLRLFVSLPPTEGRESPGLFAEPWEDLLIAGGGRHNPARAYDRLGLPVWSAPEPVTGLPHHDAEVHDDGLVLLTALEEQDDDDTPTQGFGIEEIGWDGDTRFSWSSFDHLPRLTAEDPYHANAVRRVVDALGEAYWVSSRNQHALLRIDPVTGAETHRLGRTGDFTLLDEAGVVVEDWFFNQHDPHFEGDRVFLIDNGGRRRPSSRVLELTFDLQAHTATIVRQWTEPGWYTPVMGGIERLEDGDWLLTRTECDACELGGPDLVHRLDPDSGAIDWRLVFEEAPDVYRARRIDPCRLFPETCRLAAAR